MDSQDRDESKIRRREETLARRMGEALDQLNPNSKGDCPDAEVIAAYADQALAPAESTQWEGHFATCARCRNILRVLAASADAPLAEKEVEQLGQLVSAVHAPVEINRGSLQNTRPKIVDWRTRWLAPALGVAAVLAVWFTMRPPWRAANHDASPTLIAEAHQDEMPASPAPPAENQLSKGAQQSPQDQKKEAAPSPDRFASNSSPLNSPGETPGKRRAEVGAAMDKVSPNMGEANGPIEEKKKLSASSDGREIQSPTAPPPPPQSLKAQAAMAAPVSPQSQAKASSNVVTAESAPVEGNANGISNAPRPDKQVATLQAEAGAIPGGAANRKTSPELQSDDRNEQTLGVARPMQKYSALSKAPSGSILWRAGNGGSIERSTDAGKTWASQVSPSREDWLASAQVSDTVCWVAGRNGAIARTLDGEHWARVAPPSQAVGDNGKQPDWASIAARDSRSATITAADGRQFATADGGKTWQTQ